MFVLSKTPKDCFFCFSRLKNIKYSSWQYIQYIYTEQFLMIKRNAYLLRELQKLNPGQNIDLDDQDYLDPIMAKQAHLQGINMEFMVNYVGGDEYNDAESEAGYLIADVPDDFTMSTGARSKPSSGNEEGFAATVERQIRGDMPVL